VEATKQKEEKRKKPKPEEHEGMPLKSTQRGANQKSRGWPPPKTINVLKHNHVIIILKNQCLADSTPK
jgi:hypothetical protein